MAREPTARSPAPGLDELGQLPHDAAPAGSMRWESLPLRERNSPFCWGWCAVGRGRVPDVIVPSGHWRPFARGERIADAGARCCTHILRVTVESWILQDGRAGRREAAPDPPTSEQLTGPLIECCNKHADPVAFQASWFCRLPEVLCLRTSGFKGFSSRLPPVVSPGQAAGSP